MSIGPKGQNLIFLISQPRAGSTLLQRILGSHPEIHTFAEPWLMLHPLYALRSQGYEAEYNATWARNAVEDFIGTLHGDDNEYIEGLRRMYSYLYDRALAVSGKRYFLDKTPRYYFIIPELYNTFPEAHYIILLRNPLSVLSSIFNTWAKGNGFLLNTWKHDLVQAPRLLLEGTQMLGEQALVVHYEQLVGDPASQIPGICRKLNVKFTVEMIEYSRHDLPRWRLGDQQEIYQHTRPVSQNAAKWVQALEDPQVWRLASDYLQFLGQETVAQMGYPYEQLSQVLEVHRPSSARLWLTSPLARLIEKPIEERKWWERDAMQLKRSARRRGIRRTMGRAARKAAQALFKPG
jgi:hypothetical protein